MTIQSKSDRAQINSVTFKTPKLTFMGVLRSELIKFMSVPMNKVLTAAIFCVSVLFAWLVASNVNQTFEWYDRMDAAAQELFISNATTVGTFSLFFLTIIFMAIGIINMGAEYGSRTIETTLLAAPKRATVYAAKMLLLTIYSIIFGVLSAFLSFCVSWFALLPEIREFINITDVLLNWIAPPLVLCAMILFGFGLGALLRNTAAAIVVGSLIVFILPFMLALIGIGVGVDGLNIFEYTIINLISVAQSIGTTTNGILAAAAPEITAVKAILALFVWAFVSVALGWLRFKIADAK